MSSETDHPRQRTVAELLAEHGAGSAATGRRRRRRESDDEPAGGAGPAGGTPPPANGASAPGPTLVNGGAAPLFAAPVKPSSVNPPTVSSPTVNAAPVNPAPVNGGPANGTSPYGDPANGAPANGGSPYGGPANGTSFYGGAANGGSSYGGAANGTSPYGGPANGTSPYGGPADGAPAHPPVSAPPVNGGSRNGRAGHHNGNGIAPAAWAFPPSGPDRSILREPVPQEAAPDFAPPDFAPPDFAPPDYAPPDYAPPDYAPPEFTPRDFAPRMFVPEPEQPRAAPPRRGSDIPTDHLPRYREERTGMLDPGLTGPIAQQHRPAPALDEPTLDPDDGGPSTMVGAAPVGAEAWHRSRVRSRSDDDDDGGGPATQAAVMPDFDARPAGLDDDIDLEEPRRRLGRSAGEPSPGQAWAAVVAQWIVGAIGGAALWVGFRFLWRELPVVALAAAVLVTVGLVLIVRALLRNSDMRTTVFAVLVGLLLTVSPAILVLMGR